MLDEETALAGHTFNAWSNGSNIPPVRMQMTAQEVSTMLRYGQVGPCLHALMRVLNGAALQLVVVMQLELPHPTPMFTCVHARTPPPLQNPIIFLVNNGGYTIEVEIHDGPYNTIKNWDYTALISAMHNGQVGL